jgi:NAD(P)-dependent dehydrogenase (short-subunit alcohol dehydrogenase family)
MSDTTSQRGKLALITGSNSGIGLETAVGLARVGATVILSGRNETKLAEATDAVRARVPDADLATLPMDLADLTSIEKAAATLADRPLDLLINNAGVMAIPDRRTTVDGFELTFGTNHLGHFALTGHLLPALLRADAGRVITVSAIAAHWTLGRLTDPQSERHYRPMWAYAKSKFANVVFTEELNRRAANTRLIAAVVHPSASPTGLQQHGSRVTQWLAKALLGRLLGLNVDMAAVPSIHAATSPEITGGEFIGPRGRADHARPVIARLPRNATDPELGARLWAESERLTAVHYDFA